MSAREAISDAELSQWAEKRADDAGQLARELVAYRRASLTPDVINLVTTALEHASFALDGVVALDDEDEGKDGGSETCQHTKRTVDRALAAIRAIASGGKQEPVAYRVHAPEDEHYGTGPDRLQFHPLAPHDLNNGYRQTPLYTRPSEQAVTEAMVDKVLDAAGDYMGKQYGNTALHHPTDRARIKAAMEAGHD